MTTELSLKLIAEPVTHFAVKRRGKRWVNPLYNLLTVQYQVAEGRPATRRGTIPINRKY